MTVRAKFQCVSKEQFQGGVWDETHSNYQPGFLYGYKFQAVTRGTDEENNKFFASTPTGNLTIQAVRDDLFVPGQEYYLDFTPVSQPVPA